MPSDPVGTGNARASGADPDVDFADRPRRAADRTLERGDDVRAVKWIVALSLIGGLGFFGYQKAAAYLAARSKVEFVTAAADRGELESVVRSTGEVQPVLSVTVGSFVSGPVVALHADFNDQVEEGQLLAEIDPRIYEAAVAGDRATLATSNAEVDRIKATLQQAKNDEQRAMNLRRESEDYISQAEIDRFRFGRLAQEAQLQVAEAGILRAEASLQNSEANLNYTKILSPVSGIVIDRKIDPGQTLASQFQAPELFVIAPQMREEMHIFASVDEADIGQLRRAQAEDRPVRFGVYAYPEEKFTGTIDQVRFSPVAEQSVVTYPVVVSTPNPDLKLMPGMTADLEFVVETREEIVRLPNAALRFFPKAEQVRPEDRWLITGKKEGEASESGSAAAESGSTVESGSLLAEDGPPPLTSPLLGEDDAGAESDKDAPDEKDDTRHVWVVEGETLRAIPVTTGISDGKFTELLTGDVEPGTKLVTGVK